MCARVAVQEYMLFATVLQIAIKLPSAFGFSIVKSLLHATAEWTHPTRDRIAIFTHYCNIYSQYHRLLLPHEAIVTMPKLRQTLFRGV